ncbi:DUF7563 family protein [Halobacterium litoreum]|uniref:Small CPxCG-related zinc finger protein n=1 Tax=Halobacterium litoreum TaxID=2039234 RepID=A0ABD5NB07_9EURY
MPRCRNCDSHVTLQFARVFGDNEDRVHSCIDCVPNAELDDGAASVSDEPPEAGAANWGQ